MMREPARAVLPVAAPLHRQRVPGMAAVPHRDGEPRGLEVEERHRRGAGPQRAPEAGLHDHPARLHRPPLPVGGGGQRGVLG